MSNENVGIEEEVMYIVYIYVDGKHSVFEKVSPEDLKDLKRRVQGGFTVSIANAVYAPGKITHYTFYTSGR